jgi:hypothetical protein
MQYHAQPTSFRDRCDHVIEPRCNRVVLGRAEYLNFRRARLDRQLRVCVYCIAIKPGARWDSD